MIRNLVLAAFTALTLGGVALPANAASAANPALAAASEGNAQLIQVHGRSWRHCHWSDGERSCHRGGYSRYRERGYYYPNYGYNRGPGITLQFGNDRGRHRRNRDWN